MEEQVSELRENVQGMYQEMVGELQKKQKLETRNAEKQNKIINLQSETQVLNARYRNMKKDMRAILDEIEDLGDPQAAMLVLTEDNNSGGKSLDIMSQSIPL